MTYDDYSKLDRLDGLPRTAPVMVQRAPAIPEVDAEERATELRFARNTALAYSAVVGLIFGVIVGSWWTYLL